MPVEPLAQIARCRCRINDEHQPPRGVCQQVPWAWCYLCWLRRARPPAACSASASRASRSTTPRSRPRAARVADSTAAPGREGAPRRALAQRAGWRHLALAAVAHRVAAPTQRARVRRGRPRPRRNRGGGGRRLATATRAIQSDFESDGATTTDHEKTQTASQPPAWKATHVFSVRAYA